jgi:hypothetical protein
MGEVLATDDHGMTTTAVQHNSSAAALWVHSSRCYGLAALLLFYSKL